jgi:hypothetical protein
MAFDDRNHRFILWDSNGWWVVCAVVFVAIVYLIGDRNLSEETRLQRGQQALQQFVRDVNLAEENRYEATSCPICLDDFDQQPQVGLSKRMCVCVSVCTCD